MITITVKTYEEMNDSYVVEITDSLTNCSLIENIPATLMPYIAADVVAECEDLPFDLVNKSFTMTSSLID